jgi:hypothetical protein
MPYLQLDLNGHYPVATKPGAGLVVGDMRARAVSILYSRIDGHPDARCHRIESLVQGPKLALVNSRASEQVNVYIPNASAVEFLRTDEGHEFVVFSDGYRTQLLQKFKRCFTVREVAAGKFAHHERMHDNFMAAETLAELR